MKKLIVAATKKEVLPLLEKSVKKDTSRYTFSDNIDILISGIGIPHTVFSLTRILLTEKYEKLINVGIAGSYLTTLAPGTPVEITKDIFGDFGIDDNGKFIPADKTVLTSFSKSPSFGNSWLNNPNTFDHSLPKVKGITVQKVSGSIPVITERSRLFNPDVETMESAAFFFVALKFNIPFFSVRTISNMVAPRDTTTWKISLAVTNLNRYIKEKII